jgi:hypothetical protein
MQVELKEMDDILYPIISERGVIKIIIDYMKNIYKVFIGSSFRGENIDLFYTERQFREYIYNNDVFQAWGIMENADDPHDFIHVMCCSDNHLLWGNSCNYYGPLPECQVSKEDIEKYTQIFEDLKLYEFDKFCEIILEYHRRYFNKISRSSYDQIMEIEEVFN